MRARRWVHEPCPASPAGAAAVKLPSLRRSDAEDIVPAGLAFDVGREIAPFLGEVMFAMIALASAVVGDVENPARPVSEVGLRAVRHVAVEEDHVAGARRQRL